MGKKRLKWFGKIARMNPSTPARLTLLFRRIQKTQRKTTKDMVMHNETAKKRTQHELE